MLQASLVLRGFGQGGNLILRGFSTAPATPPVSHTLPPPLTYVGGGNEGITYSGGGLG